MIRQTGGQGRKKENIQWESEGGKEGSRRRRKTKEGRRFNERSERRDENGTVREKGKTSYEINARSKRERKRKKESQGRGSDGRNKEAIKGSKEKRREGDKRQK